MDDRGDRVQILTVLRSNRHAHIRIRPTALVAKAPVKHLRKQHIVSRLAKGHIRRMLYGNQADRDPTAFGGETHMARWSTVLQPLHSLLGKAAFLIEIAVSPLPSSRRFR
jgi:hypothetical protein